MASIDWTGVRVPNTWVVEFRLEDYEWTSLDGTVSKFPRWQLRCEKCGATRECRRDLLARVVARSGTLSTCQCSRKCSERHPLFHVWASMKARCYRPKSKAFKNYGGRGITVCDRWRGSFWTFVEDMGDRPPGASIDRIDPNGNYEPGNCKWATLQEQVWNKRSSLPRIAAVLDEVEKLFQDVYVPVSPIDVIAVIRRSLLGSS